MLIHVNVHVLIVLLHYNTVLMGYYIKHRRLCKKWQKTWCLIMTQRLIKTVGMAYKYAEWQLLLW